MAKNGDSEQPAPIGSSPIWVYTVCFYFLFTYLFGFFLRAKPSDHLNLMYTLYCLGWQCDTSCKYRPVMKFCDNTQG